MSTPTQKAVSLAFTGPLIPNSLLVFVNGVQMSRAEYEASPYTVTITDQRLQPGDSIRVQYAYNAPLTPQGMAFDYIEFDVTLP